MNLDGRRESTNVDDRRGLGRGVKAGVGLGGTIVIALIVMLLGGDPSSVLEGVSSIQGTEQTEGHVGFSAEEQELASFTKKVLAGTEDVWTAIFAKYGYEYDPPKMVLYSGSTTSGCGAANSSVGAVLLFRRPERLYRPQLLHLDEAADRSGRRPGLRLRDRP